MIGYDFKGGKDTRMEVKQGAWGRERRAKGRGQRAMFGCKDLMCRMVKLILVQ
jgi:hypothetical protein